jgi:ankyrin repeat protein
MLIFLHLEQASADGATPLHIAAHENHHQCMTALLAHGATVDTMQEKSPSKENAAILGYGFLPLRMAIAANLGFCRTNKPNLTAIVAVPSSVHPTLDRPDNNGATPLLMAAQENSQECMVILLDHGADVDKADNDGHTGRHKSAPHRFCNRCALRSLRNRFIMTLSSASAFYYSTSPHPPVHRF